MSSVLHSAKFLCASLPLQKPANSLASAEMVPFPWICFVFLVNLGKCERPEESIRHHTTRYLTLGSGFLRGNDSYREESQPSAYGIARRSRPLFSWDAPTEALSKTSSRINISPMKPTVWHARRKQKTYFQTAKPAHRPKPLSHASPAHAISFRKSYVYKAIPSEEAKPAPSKKVIYVVSNGGRLHRRKGGERGKICKNPRKCSRKGGRGRYLKVDDNETVKIENVDEFPKGLIAEGAEELRNSWHRRRNKHGNPRFKARKRGRAEARNPGLCAVFLEKCEQICTEENGSATCSCYSGFTLVNGTKCVDIDECRIDNGGCDGKCVNTVGSRRCLCPEGYRLSPADDKCLDINECLLRNGHGPCQDKCINTRGGYYCTCDGLRGAVLSSDNHTCEEVNDCNSGTAGCSHSCISTFGRSFCTCPDGYELGDDWKTCHDIDECSELQEQCEFGCINTVGSYYCEMRTALSGG